MVEGMNKQQVKCLEVNVLLNNRANHFGKMLNYISKKKKKTLVGKHLLAIREISACFPLNNFVF